MFWFDHEDGDAKYDIIIELPEGCSVEDCIIMSVKNFQKQLDFHSTNSRELSTSSSDYLLYSCKANGKAYFDFPSFAMEQKLAETRTNKFCLVESQFKDDFSSSSSSDESTEELSLIHI